MRVADLGKENTNEPDMRKGYISHMRPATAQTSLRKSAGSFQPLLFGDM